MDEINISIDKQKLDIEVIYNFLKSAYWAKDRSKSMVIASIENSICFGVYIDTKQIGFARVVSDHIVFAYLMDVFILPEYRGRGYGVTLIQFIMNSHFLKDVQNWLLATSDAHNLYKKFGFSDLPKQNNLMKRIAY